MIDPVASPRKRSFEPVVEQETRVLVLGSLPGEASLAAGRYYAHPRNLFWLLTGAVINQPNLVDLPYAERLKRLLESGIGLWDVVKSGRRSGSLDADLRDVEGNALVDLIDSLPHLRAIAFNGATAARIGKQLLVDRTGLVLLALPSSSPAYAAMPAEEKVEAWLALRPFLSQR